MQLGQSTISPRSKLSQLKIELSIEKYFQNKEYASYRLTHGQFNYAFFFRDDDITSISMTLREYMPTSWNDSTEEKLLIQKLQHDKVLNKWFPDGNNIFNWGTVTSMFDKKSWISSIWISYSTE
ncbi:hypothetical protein COB57_06290 [Candidatus Peregrinibacteria bacterium]|nr:MAG: hypothetical protein COB57_06290 [Candidatus Peregrinibacteria bacterium]